MKRILLILMFITSTIFAQETALHSILEKVSIPNVNKAVNDAKNLQKELSSDNFSKFVASWKSVEAIYFAGEIDNDYLDTPRYIDVFHNLKENLHKQMSRVINSKDAVKIALFKNSFRTINALEYVLFNDENITQREKEISIEILNTIISNLEDINEVYTTYLKAKPKSEKWENALIINTLIASSYRLKEWRIGDASGNSSKYKDDLKNSRAEYFLSQNSFNSITSILNAHDEVIGNKKYFNFASMAKNSGASEQIKEAQTAILKSKGELSKLETDDFSNAKDLFEAVRTLHNAYYLSLIEQLSVTAKILDADGD
jgi:hypothetical protein